MYIVFNLACVCSRKRCSVSHACPKIMPSLPTSKLTPFPTILNCDQVGFIKQIRETPGAAALGIPGMLASSHFKLKKLTEFSLACVRHSLWQTQFVSHSLAVLEKGLEKQLGYLRFWASDVRSDETWAETGLNCLPHVLPSCNSNKKITHLWTHVQRFIFSFRISILI